jgi:para-nitrobenzyl esterase
MQHLSAKFLLTALALVAAAAILSGCTSNSWLSTRPAAVVESGLLVGARTGKVNSFKGIPYAAPPLGELRWSPPELPGAWQGGRTALDYMPHCAQIDPGILWFELDEISEDCLALNVWSAAPSAADELPVMVWIHGGGYMNGSGNIPRLNSLRLAEQGIVLVTINYRLSVFGFLNHPALAASRPAAPVGNYGLLDVVAALEWIQRNISAFGGNPNNVTVFGESAGAGIVNTLLVMPAAEGLFHRAISQSASVGLAPDPYPEKRAGFLPPANRVGETYAKRLGVADYKSASPAVARTLRAFSTDELLSVLSPVDRFTPVVDGQTLPDQVGALLAANRQHKVPYLTGGNSWEASLGRQIGGGFSPEFAARLLSEDAKKNLYQGLTGDALSDQIFGDLIVLSGSSYTADQMVKSGAPVYRYFMSYVAQARRDSQPGVAHTNDIAFVMQTLENEPDLDVITAEDRGVSDLMSAYWVQFAKSGNPNRAGLPEWPAYDLQLKRTLEIGDAITVREDMLGERMDFHIARGLDLLEKARAK